MRHAAMDVTRRPSPNFDERALDTLELEPDSDFPTIRKAYRLLAKQHHPDIKQGDAEAAKHFQAIQAAYEVLKRAEERRTGAKL